MRPTLAFTALALPIVGHALSMFDWIYPGSVVNTVSSDVIPHRIAIIGAGAGGSSAAFWASKARAHSGVNVEIDVYEKAEYVGGRSTVVFPHNRTFEPVEIGASVFVEANKNLWRATQEFNLTRVDFDDGDWTGFWDGNQFAFTMNHGNGIFGWIDTVKAVLRYGYKSPIKAQSIVKDLIKTFLSFYGPINPSWTNVSDVVSVLDWSTYVNQTAAHYYDSQGISRKFSREVIEAATRVNYGQNLDVIHALEGTVSIAANGASGVKGGNFQIFERFLAHSGAKVHLNTTVSSLTEKADHWVLRTANGEAKNYNDVILAAPYHQAGIKVSLSSGLLSLSATPEVPEQPYVHLHVTLLATTAPHPIPEYFALKPGSKVPTTILTTWEGARNGGPIPEFNSLSYHGKLSPDNGEYVVKIFSRQTISDEWLNKIFDGKVSWVHRREFQAYPELPPTSTFPPVVLAPGLYYVNSFEPLISTMETETISSRNIVDQLFQNRFGSDICGKAIPAVAEQPEPIIVLEGEAQQLVMADSVVEEIKAETDPPKPVNVKDDFVYGWDCV